jgi:hypothetical protein
MYEAASEIRCASRSGWERCPHAVKYGGLIAAFVGRLSCFTTSSRLAVTSHPSSRFRSFQGVNCCRILTIRQ